MMRSENYQYSLIALGLAASAILGVFFYRELYPEYKIYQNDYIALEKFRSSYTGEPPPAFQTGVKQILIEKEDKGNPIIDRCISCHVALQFPHFSPTKIAYENGKPLLDEHGMPQLIQNEDYIWDKLEAKIASLTDPKVNAMLLAEGKSNEIKIRQNEAENLKALKVAHIGEHTYDVTKVLMMHPLIGKETRPFEFHPVEEYGCSSCHNGNGRGLTTGKAHGPLFDGQYKKEDMGHVPHFTEVDKANDPIFSTMFNGKPGHELLFQTMPILVGAVIQSKCVQCHQVDNPILGTKENRSNLPGTLKTGSKGIQPSDLDLLTYNFQRGQELFINQACYACHRIAGMSRGGVGPELTDSGKTYPWFLKESIVWPQADLATSTMPNFRLDHTELEDLVTFLLGQMDGNNQAVSKTAYKKNIQEWESGRKQNWEKPITPKQMNDLSYSMTVFATEGCAACHRLLGFESNTGFTLEKEKPSFDELYAEKSWFQQLIPENITGSSLVKVVEAHAEEFDQRISDGIRTHSILNKIEDSYPQTLESFYTPFRFASRAKDAEFSTQIDSEYDPKAKEKLKSEWQQWKNRIHRLLLIYIQEYGLGRLIGPRPNWSGVYHTDEWLMEHFRNPASHVPRSIMPVFPFDDTKFYALTHMLDVLGIRNRNAVREVWDHRGFNPEQAFEMYCAQCHGPFLYGNGPVAEWIYPIPKNLHNADFLRNLTREKAITSITHGVKGTPMPPWGETADKDNIDGVPVLTNNEIVKLVDWLYTSLPGNSGFSSSDPGVPKWKYSILDVTQELKNEGGFDPFFKGSLAKDNLFDVSPNPYSGSEKDLYSIKKQFYTPENIEQGRLFFEMNCAVCHGKDADGAGMRAGTMIEAKPRMLTNLDWIKTRDDLRLLRSIKFGVAGTAMTPWGDFTSSLQRLQLVMFIRTLTAERAQTDELAGAIYDVFDNTELLIERARVQQYVNLDNIESEYLNLRSEREKLYSDTKKIKDSSKESIDIYQQELEHLIKLHALQKRDELFIDLKKLVKMEKENYLSTGSQIIQSGSPEDLSPYLKMIGLLKGRLELKDNQLVYGLSDLDETAIANLGQTLITKLDSQIDRIKQEKVILEGKIPSADVRITLHDVSGRLHSLEQLKKRLAASLAEGINLRHKEKKLVDEITKQISEPAGKNAKS